MDESTRPAPAAGSAAPSADPRRPGLATRLLAPARGFVEWHLLDSPFSHLGHRAATLVGCVVGGILSTGRVEVDEGLIVFRGMPSWAFGRGGTCVGSAYLTRESVSPRILKHERVHVRQWKRYGFLFPALYWAAGLDPLRNRFEIEAGLEDGGYARAPRREDAASADAPPRPGKLGPRR